MRADPFKVKYPFFIDKFLKLLEIQCSGSYIAPPPEILRHKVQIFVSIKLSHTFYQLITPINSRHSPLDIPDVSCVTSSPFSIRFTQSNALPDMVAPPRR